MIYRGETALKAYKGDYRPVNIYTGETKTAGWHNETKSGESVEFDGTYNDEAAVVVNGKCQQTVTVQGKNLLPYPYTQTTLTHNGIAFTDNGDGSIRAVGTSTDYSYFNFVTPAKPFKAVIGTTYTVSGGRGAGRNLVIAPYINNAVSWANALYCTSTLAFTAAYTDYYVAIQISSTVGAIDLMFYPQIELGSTATAYAPFVPNRPSPNYPSPILSAGNCNLITTDGVQSEQIAIPTLRKFGDVADSYDPVTGEYVQRVGVRILTSADGWGYSTGYFLAALYLGSNSAYREAALCTHVPYSLNAASPTPVFWIDSTGNGIRFRYPAIDGNLSAFLSFIAAEAAVGRPVTMYYVLATPITTMLTPTNAIPTYPHHTQITTDGAVKADLSVTAKVSDAA